MWQPFEEVRHGPGRRAGLVMRTADLADGRASMLALTPLGHETLNNVVRWYDDLLADALRTGPPAT
jgi:DNA-binding MarR family transcriptional regulator